MSPERIRHRQVAFKITAQIFIVGIIKILGHQHITAGTEMGFAKQFPQIDIFFRIFPGYGHPVVKYYFLRIDIERLGGDLYNLLF